MSLTLELSKYKAIIFDEHGVILDSNITNIDSYFRTAKKIGATNEQAQALVDYHVKLGGISKHLKFKWYFEDILKLEATPLVLQEYIDAFSIAVKKECSLAE
jgi:hypothetical protein